MSDNPEVGTPSPPVYAPAAAQGDTHTFLLIGAIGAFATALVAALQFIPMMKLGQAGLIAQAVVGLAGLIGMGIGFLGFARKTQVSIAKVAGILLFVYAAFALLPLLAMAAKSRGLMKVIIYASPFVSAITWVLVAQSLLGARSLLGGVAGAIGWTLMACALIEIIMFFISVSGGIRSRTSMEILQTLMYISIAARMLALGGVGAMLLQARNTR